MMDYKGIGMFICQFFIFSYFKLQSVLSITRIPMMIKNIANFVTSHHWFNNVIIYVGNCEILDKVLI